MSLQQMVSSQCLTLGSRKIDCKQTHYTTFSIKKLDPSVKHWDDISGHCRHKGTSVLL
ncbi:MAG: hypothetical protein ACR5LA_07720 [Wolbachia sp.]